MITHGFFRPLTNFFDDFIGYCLDRRFNYRFFDLFDNLINFFDDFIGYCLNRQFNDGFFDLFDFSSTLSTTSSTFEATSTPSRALSITPASVSIL